MKHKSTRTLLGWLPLFIVSLTGCPSQQTVKTKALPQQISAETGRNAETAYRDAVSTYQSGKQEGKINHDNVIKYLREALAKSPSMHKARLSLAKEYETTEKYPEAEKELQTILQREPKNTKALYQLSQIYVRQKQYPRALHLYQRYIESNPKEKESQNSLVNLASLQLETESYDQALKTARKLLFNDPKDLVGYRLLARIYLKQKRYKTVFFVNELAQKTGKKDAKLFNILGMSSLQQKKYPQAMYYFLEATKLEPTLFEAQMNLGTLSLNNHDYSRALKSFEEAVKIRPRNKEALLSYAVTLRVHSRYKESEKVYLERILPHHKNDPDALFNISLLYLNHLDDPAKAKIYLRRCIGERDSPEARTMLKNVENAIKMKEYMKKQKKSQETKKS